MAAIRTGGNVFCTLMRRNKLTEMKLNRLRHGNSSRQQQTEIIINNIRELLVEYKELERENQRLTDRLEAIKQQRSLRRFLCCFGVTGDDVEEDEDEGHKEVVEEKENVIVVPEQEEEQQEEEQEQEQRKNGYPVQRALDMKRRLQEELEEMRAREELIKKKELLLQAIEELKVEKDELANRNLQLADRVAFEEQSFICRFFSSYVKCRRA